MSGVCTRGNTRVRPIAVGAPTAKKGAPIRGRPFFNQQSGRSPISLLKVVGNRVRAVANVVRSRRVVVRGVLERVGNRHVRAIVCRSEETTTELKPLMRNS